jgi:magnesium transporter
MISRYTYHDVTWVDMENPSKEEMAHIMEEFSIPSLVTEEAISNTLHAKVELYDNLIYMILHFPPSKRASDKTTEQEIDFIIGKNFLITTHYETIYPIEQFAKLFELRNAFGQEKKNFHGGFLFVEMMKQFYEHSLHKLDEITKVVKEIEYYIFNGQENLMVKKISDTGKKLLDFKQALRFHQDILRSYENASVKLFDNDYRYYAEVVTSEFNKVNSLLESNRDALAELQRTNDSLLSSKTNDTMRTFTILTFVLTPLMLISGIFGMNTADGLIFINNKADFFFVLGAMVLTGLTMFLFFKLRKWL